MRGPALTIRPQAITDTERINALDKILRRHDGLLRWVFNREFGLFWIGEHHSAALRNAIDDLIRTDKHA